MSTREQESFIRIEVRVHPRSSSNQVERVAFDRFSVRTTAPAVDGKANQMVLKLLAKELSVPKSAFKILLGENSRKKLIEVQQSGFTLGKENEL